MASFQLFFSPRSISAFESQIRPNAEEFEILKKRLLGRADDLGTSFDSAGKHFTDQIGWNIDIRGEEDYQHWVDASVALEYAIDTTEMWADYVKEFNDKKNELWDEWDAAVAAKVTEVPEEYQGQTITSDYPVREGWIASIGGSDANKCRDLYDELLTKLNDINERAQANYDNYQENAAEIGEMLEQGATDVNVQKLIDGGYSNWAYANTDPERYLELESDFEITPESGRSVAEELDPYFSGEKPLDDRYHELMLVLAMVGTNARNAQHDGEELDENEVDFLREFNASLEETNPRGVVGIPEMLGDSLTEEERSRALGVIGDGLLALSDHRLGGGYEELPESVRRTAQGPFVDEEGQETPYFMPTYAEDARGLSEIFGNASEEIEGGNTLSTNLLLSSGAYYNYWASEGDGGWLTLDEMGTLFDVGVRNEDANHFILTGDLYNPESEDVEFRDQDRLTALEGLFANNWEDDGARVRQLTDWISRDGGSEDPEIKARADSALAGYIETLARPDVQEFLLSTEHSIEEEVQVTNDDGTQDTEDFEWFDVPMGQLNPELADSMVNIFEAYIDAFSDSSVWTGDEMVANLETDFDEDDGLLISMEDRRMFFQYLSGDAESTERAMTAAEEFSREQVSEYFENAENEESSKEIAQETGLLWSALSHGISDAFDQQYQNHSDELGQRKKGMEFVVDLTATRFDNPLLAETYKYLAKDYVADYVDDNTGERVEVRVVDEIIPVLRGQFQEGGIAYHADQNSETWGSEPWAEGGGPFPRGMYDNDGVFKPNPDDWHPTAENYDDDGDHDFRARRNSWEEEAARNDMRDDAWRPILNQPVPGDPYAQNYSEHEQVYMDAVTDIMNVPI